jgi:hypothetical protein
MAKIVTPAIMIGASEHTISNCQTSFKLFFRKLTIQRLSSDRKLIRRK